MSDFMQEAEENVKELIKNMLLSEGFTEERIDKELTKIDIQVNIKTSEIKTQQAIQYTVSVTNEHTPESNSSQIRDTTRFSFDGGVKYYNKRKFVLEIIKDYIKKHPGITFNELEKVFYPEIHSRSRGVVKRYTEVQLMVEKSKDIKKRYFLDGDIITLSDGTQIAVNNQWGTRFPYFLNAIKDIYSVISDNEYRV